MFPPHQPPPRWGPAPGPAPRRAERLGTARGERPAGRRLGGTGSSGGSPTAMQSGWFFQVPPCRLPRPVPAPATPAGLGERAGTRGPGGARLTPLSPRRGLWAPFRIPHLKARDAGAPAADKAGTQPLSEAPVEPGIHSPALPGRALRLPAWRLSTRPRAPETLPPPALSARASSGRQSPISSVPGAS